MRYPCLLRVFFCFLFCFCGRDFLPCVHKSHPRDFNWMGHSSCWHLLYSGCLCAIRFRSSNCAIAFCRNRAICFPSRRHPSATRTTWATCSSARPGNDETSSLYTRGKFSCTLTPGLAKTPRSTDLSTCRSEFLYIYIYIDFFFRCVNYS